MPKANNDSVFFKCISCNFEALIPIQSVYFFDIFDPNDIDSPPCVGCNLCSGTMFPAHLSS